MTAPAVLSVSIWTFEIPNTVLKKCEFWHTPHLFSVCSTVLIIPLTLQQIGQARLRVRWRLSKPPLQSSRSNGSLQRTMAAPLSPTTPCRGGRLDRTSGQTWGTFQLRRPALGTGTWLTGRSTTTASVQKTQRASAMPWRRLIALWLVWWVSAEQKTNPYLPPHLKSHAKFPRDVINENASRPV